MKTVVLTALLWCCPWAAFAQYVLQGYVSNGGEMLPGVNVMLFKDSTLIESARTDGAGHYKLQNVAAGTYIITGTFIGYDPHHSRLVVSGDKREIHIAEIVLKEITYELNAVEITASKPAVEHQLDRMVIRPTDAIVYSGNSVLEVLQKSPGIVVNRQTGSINVNGRPGARVLINDKAVQVPPEVALQMLDGMTADQVESIEVVAVPSSTYDAEGVAGVINIVMRKNSELGTNGSMTITAGAHWAETLGFSGNVNRRTERLAIYLDYSILRNHNRHVLHMYRETQMNDLVMASVDDSPRENITIQQNFRTGIEWQIANRWIMNAQLTGYSRNWSLDATTHNSTAFTNDSSHQTNLHVTEHNIWRSATGSIGVTHQLNDRRQMDMTVDYLYYHNNNPSNYIGDMSDAGEIKLSKKTPVNFVVSTVQYVSLEQERPFAWDAGVKAAISSFDNRVKAERLSNGEWSNAEQFSSNSIVNERILAAYMSAIWKPNDELSITAGLRYEYTNTDIDLAPDESLTREYDNLFPQLSLRRQFVSGDEVFIGYSRRITRPTYNDMAPYVFFWNSNAFSSGNTFLLPALSDNFSAGTQRGPWNWTVMYSHAKNAIAQMQPEIIKSTSALVFRSQNLEASNTWSLSTSYNTALSNWWDIRADVVIQYHQASISFLPAETRRSLWGINANAHSTMRLPHEFTFEVSAIYQSRSMSGICDFLPSGSLDAAIARRIGRSGSLKLAVDDILYTNRWRIRANSPENNLNVHFDYDWHNQFIRLSYTWTMGNARVRGVKSMQGSEDERRRVTP